MSQNPFNVAQGAGGADKCPRCGKTMYESEKVIAAGKSWHKRGCFTCSLCNKSLELATVAVAYGDIYCRDCYRQKFGPTA